MTKMMNVIDLEWEGSFKILYDRDEDKYLLHEIPTELLSDSGLYQIYGSHPVYGRDVLLYIGETKRNIDDTRTFKKRLGEHFSNKFFDHTNLSIYLAPISVKQELIEQVESVLIYSHIPALNKKYIDCPKDGCENLLIRNYGFMGSLNHVCTGYWDEES